MSVLLRVDVTQHEHDDDHTTQHIPDEVIVHALTPLIRGTTANEASPATIAVMVPVTVP